MTKNLLLALAILLSSPTLRSEIPVEMQSKREIFVDSHLIDQIEGIQLQLKEPVDKGIVMRFDAPWEGRFSAYATVLHDTDRYRLYYRGIPEAGNDGSETEVTCYAESRDGINWNKPELGLFEVHGSKNNNVILANAAPITHNFCPFIDSNPNTPPQEKYKAMGGIASSGLFAFQSPDGIHWNRIQPTAVFKPEGWVLDSQNVAFWSKREQCYVLHYRSSVHGVRAIAKTTSQDFLTWTTPRQMTYSDTGTTQPSHHLYTNQTHPYFRAPHIYLATAARFLPGRQVLTDDQAHAIDVHPKYFKDTSDSILMSTRGTHRYDRSFLSALIKPGIGAVNWVSRSNYPVLNLVPTGPHEMSLYVNQNYGQPSAHLRRYAFRLDGLSCLKAPYEGGEWTSKPLTFEGQRLTLNFATSAAGSIRVELQDPQNRALPGFRLEDSTEIIGNETERTVTWKSGRKLEEVPQPIRIRMKMQDAELFSIQFQTVE